MTDFYVGEKVDVPLFFGVNRKASMSHASLVVSHVNQPRGIISWVRPDEYERMGKLCGPPEPWRPLLESVPAHRKFAFIVGLKANGVLP